MANDEEKARVKLHMNRLLQVQLLSLGQMVLRALFVFMDPVHVVCVCVWGWLKGCSAISNVKTSDNA